jgi:hypothetical protein
MRTPLIVSLILTLTAAGCGAAKEKEPVEFGVAMPAAERIELPTPPDGGVIPAGRWPGACAFLTDDEITALLPQATDIERKPKVVSVLTLDKEQRAQAAEGECAFQFWLKDATVAGITSSVSVGIQGVADPAVISRHYGETLAADRKRTDRSPVEDLGDRFGPEACYSWVSSVSFFTLVCREGPMIFQVTGGGYGTFPGVPDGDQAAQGKHWRDKVQGPAAGLVAAKLSLVIP